MVHTASFTALPGTCGRAETEATIISIFQSEKVRVVRYALEHTRIWYDDPSKTGSVPAPWGSEIGASA